MQCDFEHSTNDLNAPGEAAGRRQNNRKLIRGNTAAFDDFIRHLGRRQPVNFKYDRRPASGVAIAQLFKQRFTTPHGTGRARAERKKRRFTFTVVEAPSRVLRSQTGDNRVIGADIDLPAPLREG